MLLTDKEYLQLGTILRIIADIIEKGYSGKDDFIKKVSHEIKNTPIEIETVRKVASRLELLNF